MFTNVSLSLILANILVLLVFAIIIIRSSLKSAKNKRKKDILILSYKVLNSTKRLQVSSTLLIHKWMISHSNRLNPHLNGEFKTRIWKAQAARIKLKSYYNEALEHDNWVYYTYCEAYIDELSSRLERDF
jgi:hypothetical protein